MELDHPNALCQSGEEKSGSDTSNVQEEIEQRWHQVETTPLREAKQVPITTTFKNSERLPAHELAALLDKEVRLRNIIDSHSLIYYVPSFDEH